MAKHGYCYNTELLKDFANQYNYLKNKDMIPKDIKSKLCETFVITYDSKYYNLLRRCRQLTLITDTYKENRTAMVVRLRDEKITIVTQGIPVNFSVTDMKQDANGVDVVMTNIQEKKKQPLFKRLFGKKQ